MAAALPLAAQPKLLVNAQTDTRVRRGGPGADVPAAGHGAAAAGLDRIQRADRTGSDLGCDYVRDGWNQPGVIHLEPPDHAVILFRVDNGAVERIRTLSPDCEIDAGNLPMHWLNDVKPAESVALLDTFATQRERYMDGAMTRDRLARRPGGGCGAAALPGTEPAGIHPATCGELVRRDARAARVRRTEKPDRQRPERPRPRTGDLHAWQQQGAGSARSADRYGAQGSELADAHAGDFGAQPAFRREGAGDV